MKTKLTKEDIKKLNYQKRPGFVVSIAIFILGLIMTLTAISVYENNELYTLLIFLVTIIISGIVAYLMIGKYQKDISNKEKILEVKTIQKKESITDYEAGSGSMYLGQKMNAFDKYSIIIENTRFDVDKDFYETCNAGDDVTFHIAPKSKHRIKMVLNKNNMANKNF